MSRVTATVLLLTLVACTAAQQQESPLTRHARGTFTVDVHPLTPAPADGLGRMSIDKQIHGDLEATTKGEMIIAGNPRQGASGYVAMEMVTGTLAGKRGSFALMHRATMDAGGREMLVTIVPGSGTGELKDISGTFKVEFEGSKHLYDLAYTLPQ
jgi:hypothetical protein